MRIFYANSIVAPTWATAIGETDGRVNVIVVAHSKADVGPLVEDRGAGGLIASTVAASAKLTTGENFAARVMDAVGADRPGVYLLPRSGIQVFRLNFDRTVSIVAVREGDNDYRPQIEA